MVKHCLNFGCKFESPNNCSVLDRDAFDNLKTMNNELQQENLKNDETITSLKLDLEENKQKLKTLEDKNCSLVEDIRMLRNRCSILDADRTLLKTQLEDMGATSSELKIKSMYLQRKVENLNCELNQAYVNLLDFERRLTNTTDGVERSVEIFNGIFCKIEVQLLKLMCTLRGYIM